MKLTRLVFSSLLLSSFVTACASVGPNYEIPPILAKSQIGDPKFAGLNSPDANKIYTTDTPKSEWWKLFDDELLNKTVLDALAANTDLRIALANLDKSQAYIRQVRGAQLPTTKLSASEVRTVPSGYALGFVQDPVPSGEFWDAGGTLSLDLDFAGRLRRLVESAKADADAAQAAYDVARINVVASTVRAYAEACSSGRQLTVAMRSEKMQEESTAMVERSFKAGHGTRLDVVKARAQLSQVKSTLPVFESAQHSALFRLAALLGKPPKEYPPEVANCTTPPTAKSPIPVGDGVALLRRRPDIRQAERKLASANAQIGAATASLYPSISFGMSAGSSARWLADMNKQMAWRWSLGPLISWEFPNIVATRARIRESEASTRAAAASLDGIILNALREVETALSHYAAELDRHQNLIDARQASSDAAEIARRLFKAGAGTYFEVLDSERILESADATLASSDATLAMDRVGLFLSLGGGWEQTDVVQPVATASGKTSVKE